MDPQAQFEHQLDPKIKQEILGRAGIPKCSADLFASTINAQEDRYITENVDAFSFDWGVLAQYEPVWAYPPMEMLEKCLAKMILYKSLGIVCFLEGSVTPQAQTFLDHITLWCIPIPKWSMVCNPTPHGQ